MKVATFIIRLRVEDFDEDVLRTKSKLMEMSGCISVKHEPELDEDWTDKPVAREVQ